MDFGIALILLQDGIINGAIYALLAVSLVLVFTVTRVVFIPQGEFVAYGSLSLAILQQGMVPGSAWLLVVLGAAAFVCDLARGILRGRKIAFGVVTDLVLPVALLLLVRWLAPLRPSLAVQSILIVAVITPAGPFFYRLAFRPLADASILVLLIAAVGVHLAMVGLGLVFFGAEGYRTAPITDTAVSLGPVTFSGQSLWMIGATAVLIIALWLFFQFTLAGTALRATAVNRLGARLVGIPANRSGQIAFGMSAAIGAISGILIAPTATVFYDTGFLISLKGFVAAIVAGLISYPLSAIAALVVGVVEAFASFWSSPLKEVIVFTIILPVLLWRSLHTVHLEDEE